MGAIVTYDLAIIGAGIMGLAHAFHAARAGRRVIVLERNKTAQGASIRNFGMVAIVAQAPGAQLESARKSLADWQFIAKEAGIELRQAGCLFLARCAEELAVLQECSSSQKEGEHKFEFVQPDALPKFAPDLRLDHIKGALWSPDAWKVDQRQALSKITNWLTNEFNVAFSFETSVNEISHNMLQTSAGPVQAEHILHCAGDDFTTLFEEQFTETDITRCQLQMMRTAAQPTNWKLKPFILGGLSIPHYSVFADCPSLPALKKYQERHFADYLKFGIHLIVCQESDGTITFGDSHLYGDDVLSQRSSKIDALLVKEMGELITLPEQTISERWLGHYAKRLEQAKLELSISDTIQSVTMTNGQGMTHGFSVAAENIAKLG